MASDIENVYFNLRNGFEKYWLSTLAPFLKTKEDLRQKYVSRFFLLVLLSLFVLPLCVIGFYVLNKHFSSDINPGFLYMIIVICIFVLQTPYRIYKKKIKNDVMEKFIAYFNDFHYKQGEGLSIDEMEDSHIFPKADRYYADDCFFGTFQGVHFRVAEQILKKIQHTKHGKREYTVFQGIAVEMEMNKSFKGQTVILKDSGMFNRFKGVKGLERITLEDPTFEKLFEVYGSDQVEARFILTPVFMEQVVKLRDLYQGKSVQLSFQFNKVLIAVNTKQDMFEPCSFFKTNLNKAKIDKVFEQFLTIFSIADILKLSQNMSNK